MDPSREPKGYLVDIEGVLVRDKRYEPVAGSRDWFNALPARGIDACLVSNNTTHTPAELVAALRGVGFAVEERQLVSALALAAKLLTAWGKRRLLWLGVPRLGPWWSAQGFDVVEGGPCDAVVLGVNSLLTLDDLNRALPPLLDQGAELVALHRNAFYLDERGERRLGPGAWCAALETLSRREAVTIGKPKERLYREALERIGVSAQECLFISDDPISDLATAKRLGMATAFVLSGKYADHDVLGRLPQAEWPDIICDRAEAIG